MACGNDFATATENEGNLALTAKIEFLNPCLAHAVEVHLYFAEQFADLVRLHWPISAQFRQTRILFCFPFPGDWHEVRH